MAPIGCDFCCCCHRLLRLSPANGHAWSVTPLVSGCPHWQTANPPGRFLYRWQRMEICAAAGGLEKEHYFGAATAQLYRFHCLRFVASLAEKKKRKGKTKKKKVKERK
jgi:hypothetical protein